MAVSTNPNSLFGELISVLQNGFIGPKCSGCCPDCGNIYILASVETYLKYFEEFGAPPAQEDCCASTCIAKLQDYLSGSDFNTIMNKGIVEYSTFNGKSFICYLLDYIIENEYTLGSSSFEEVLSEILDVGIVIYCTEDKQIIGDVEEFLTIMEGLGDTIDYGAECCLSVSADGNTYVFYQNAVNPPA